MHSGNRLSTITEAKIYSLPYFSSWGFGHSVTRKMDYVFLVTNNNIPSNIALKFFA